jgi:hypothetical protein
MQVSDWCFCFYVTYLKNLYEIYCNTDIFNCSYMQLQHW